MIKFKQNICYEIADVQGKPYLFINIRLDRKTIPDNLYVYEIADGDGDGCFARIQKYVIVNFWGTLIGKEPLDLGENGVYYPPFGSAEYEGSFVGQMTLDEYMSADPDELIPNKEEGRAVNDGEYIIMKGHKYKVEFKLTEASEDKYNEEEFNDILFKTLPFYMAVTKCDHECQESNIRYTIEFTAVATESIQCLMDLIWDISEEFGLSTDGELPEIIPVSEEMN